tara:strand:+ start:1849 stop:3693 length:1845 start_codon:yes stop_codon:yes gene_type:complete
MRNLRDLKKDDEEIRSLRSRSKIISLFLFILFLFGIFKIIELTVLDRVNYEAESDKNRIINLPIYPARGIIKLTDGTIIAENIVTHDLYINGRKLNSAKDQIDQLFTKVLNEDRKLPELVLDLNSQKKIWLVKDLTEMELAKFELYKNSLTDIRIETQLKRYLPHKNLFSHVIGHLGKINNEERLSLSKKEYPHDALIGKVGIENIYEKYLKGSIGSSVVEVDVYGNKVRELDRVFPDRPSDLTLTLNFDLQTIARAELGGRRGAVVAVDPNTGYVRALVSSPDYNPNILNGSEIDKGHGKTFLEEAPFFNRAISGSYPPASTIKPFIGLLGLEENIIDENTIIEDIGFFQLKEDGRKYRGWKEEGHGKVNLQKAIVESSDVYFYDLASKLTIDRISSFLSKFGFGKLSGIDLVNETNSTLPTRNWKLGNIGESWFVGDTVNLGIGQGYITTTPLQLAISISAIPNKGIIFKPKIVENIGKKNIEPEIISDIKIKNDNHWNIIEKSMISVIESWNGTAHNLYDKDGVPIAGKTGTAQIRSLVDQELSVKEEYKDIRKDIKNRDHALFASYGPIPDPNLVVVVIVENGESGSAVAAPIAKKIIEKYQLVINPNEQ